jgi:hypothetical protein
MMEQYMTVLQLAKDAKDWPLVSLLQGTEAKEWCTVLGSIFERACENRDDQSAVRYFGMWMHATDDALLEPFTKPAKDGCVIEGSWKEIVEAQAAAISNRAESAERAWYKMPHVGDPILLETREAILTEIAYQWRGTLDEEEADKLFDFLTCAAPMHKEEYKILIGVLRKITNPSFSPERLTRHFLRYYRRQNRMSEIANVLAIGRTRNALDLANEISLVQYLHGCSDAAFRFAEEFVSNIGLLDRAALVLHRTVQSEWERRGDREDDGILQGRVEVDFQSLDTLTLTIHQRHNKEDVQDWGHGQFELARARVQSWKEKHPNISVQLTLIIRGTFFEDIVFTREQKL